MSPDIWPPDTGRLIFDTLDSTNAEAVRQIKAGAELPLWILTRQQTAGRGRRGNAWSDPVGNFAATHVMRTNGDAVAAAQRSFIAALALRDAFVALTGREDVFSLKWPNDVLLRGRKLVGILLESHNDAEFLAIGIGINLQTAPEPNATNTTPPCALKPELGLSISPDDFLPYLATAFAAREARFSADGFAAIRADWLAHAARLGEQITARLPNREITGRFDTIDDFGSLILTEQGKTHTIPAAEVYFP